MRPWVFLPLGVRNMRSNRQKRLRRNSQGGRRKKPKGVVILKPREDALPRMFQNLLHRKEKDNCRLIELVESKLFPFNMTVWKLLIDNLTKNALCVGGTKS